MSVDRASGLSHACTGLPVDFYWYGGGNLAHEQHIELAVEALMSAIKEKGRLWNPYNESFTRTQFRRRLDKAARGDLRPPKEIKALRGGNALFEIRWTHIPVRKRRPDGSEICSEIQVRLIHAQPYDQLGLCILGLHAHEKVVATDKETTKALQDAEIDRAQELFIGGFDSCWGVVRRDS